jgi:hypothetical protein
MTRQNKAGKTDVGSQRYRCMHCQWKYTPHPKHHGYPDSLRKQATRLYIDGNNLRRIACQLKVSPQTVSLWVTEAAEALPRAPVPQEVKETEMDEIFIFYLHSDCGRPQNPLYFGLGGRLGTHARSAPGCS